MATTLDAALGARVEPGDALESFFDSLPRPAWAAALWALTHPRVLLRVHQTLGRLPQMEVRPSATVDGRALVVGLSRRSAIGRVLTRGATSVLHIPDDPQTYTAGSSRRTLRKRRNAAVRAGVHWEAVGSADARRRLLALANERERGHPDVRYRTRNPDNEDLLALAFWRVARTSDGRPLLMVVAAVDGPWALLRYFRTLDPLDPDATAARYLMAEVMVHELGAAGVRELATDMSPVRMSHGIRVYQHQVGFDLRRVRLITD